MTDSKQEDKNNKSFEKLYLKERKKSQTFVTVTMLLFILLVGSVVFNIQNKKQSIVQNLNQSQDSFGPFGRNPGGFQRPRGLQVVSDFFSEDGAVDTNQVSQVKDNLPDEFEDRFTSRISSQIDDAVKEGQITSDQGEELNAAFGISNSTNVN